MRIGKEVAVLIVRKASDTSIMIRRGVKTLLPKQRELLRVSVCSEIFCNKDAWEDAGILIVPARDWIEMKEGVREVCKNDGSSQVLALGHNCDYPYVVPHGSTLEIGPEAQSEYANLIIRYTSDGGFEIFRNGKPAITLQAAKTARSAA